MNMCAKTHANVVGPYLQGQHWEFALGRILELSILNIWKGFGIDKIIEPY